MFDRRTSPRGLNKDQYVVGEDDRELALGAPALAVCNTQISLLVQKSSSRKKLNRPLSPCPLGASDEGPLSAWVRSDRCQRTLSASASTRPRGTGTHSRPLPTQRSCERAASRSKLSRARICSLIRFKTHSASSMAIL